MEGYEDFELSYWDWTDRSLLDELFTVGRIGANINGIVTGSLFSENKWNLVCTSDGLDICNASEYDRDSQNNLLKLHRCPIDKNNMRNVCENARWPTYGDVMRALIFTTYYDTYTYDDHAQNAFRNSLEGFQPLSGDLGIAQCKADDLCKCGNVFDGGDDSLCKCEDTVGCEHNRAPIRRKLHNAVSIQLCYN